MEDGACRHPKTQVQIVAFILLGCTTQPIIFYMHAVCISVHQVTHTHTHITANEISASFMKYSCSEQREKRISLPLHQIINLNVKWVVWRSWWKTQQFMKILNEALQKVKWKFSNKQPFLSRVRGLTCSELPPDRTFWSDSSLCLFSSLRCPWDKIKLHQLFMVTGSWKPWLVVILPSSLHL